MISFQSPNATTTSPKMTMKIFSPPTSIVEEGKTTSIKIPNTQSSTLVSRGSEDSMASWVSSESDSIVSTTSAGRRQIFTEYWKTNIPVFPVEEDIRSSDEEEEEDEPRSPLLPLYPSIPPPSNIASPTSTIQAITSGVLRNNKPLSKSPPRRSIFGAAQCTSYSSYNSEKKINMDRFFSKHEHMTILSSSVDSTSSSGRYFLERRHRSYSCSDAGEPPKKRPLASCLKRRQSHAKPTVTFDSQIQIVAFEPTSCLDEAPSCLDGSWTENFDF